MKNTIKRILKEENLKQELKDEVKNYGWDSAASLVGGSDTLIEVAFNNDPMEFLNMYNDMNIILDNNRVFFGYGETDKLIYYYKDEIAYIDHHEIWLPLFYGFNLSWQDVEELTKNWLSNVYKLKLESTTNFNVRHGFDY